MTPEDIEGDAVLCLPVLDVKYLVSPVDVNPNIAYNWELKSPSGKIINSTNPTAIFGNIYNNNSKQDSLFLNLNKDAEEGEYKLTVKAINTSVSDNTISNTEFTMSIMVYNTSKFSLESLADSLCAASANSQVEARHNLSSQLAGINYVYEWINDTSANAYSIAMPI